MDLQGTAMIKNVKDSCPCFNQWVSGKLAGLTKIGKWSISRSTGCLEKTSHISVMQQELVFSRKWAREAEIIPAKNIDLPRLVVNTFVCQTKNREAQKFQKHIICGWPTQSGFGHTNFTPSQKLLRLHSSFYFSSWNLLKAPIKKGFMENKNSDHHDSSLETLQKRMTLPFSSIFMHSLIFRNFFEINLLEQRKNAFVINTFLISCLCCHQK